MDSKGYIPLFFMKRLRAKWAFNQWWKRIKGHYEPMTEEEIKEMKESWRRGKGKLEEHPA